MMATLNLGWNQVFFAVDALSRRGEIILIKQRFDYEVMAADMTASPHSTSTV